tara:strand:- start:210 stop:551 length:342 start_codon:yes stop_codon:yes gene_type:complete
MYELRRKPITRGFLLNNHKFFNSIDNYYSHILLVGNIERFEIISKLSIIIKVNITLILDKRYTNNVGNVKMVQSVLDMIKYLKPCGKDDVMIKKYNDRLKYLEKKLKNTIYNF